MSHTVNIIPGKTMSQIYDLDEDLKKGCEEAVTYGNNIYVFGRHGSGKTSVLKYFYDMAPKFFGVDRSEVLFMKACDFIDKMIFSIRNGEEREFKYEIKSAQVIILDDIDRFANKDATLCEFRDILEMNKKIIISGVDDARSLPLPEMIRNKILGFTNMEIDECYDGISGIDE